MWQDVWVERCASMRVSRGYVIEAFLASRQFEQIGSIIGMDGEIEAFEIPARGSWAQGRTREEPCRLESLYMGDTG
jgi:hypothetical protein